MRAEVLLNSSSYVGQLCQYLYQLLNLCSFPGAATMNHHQLGSVKQQNSLSVLEA